MELPYGQAGRLRIPGEAHGGGIKGLGWFQLTCGRRAGMVHKNCADSQRRAAVTLMVPNGKTDLQAAIKAARLAQVDVPIEDARTERLRHFRTEVAPPAVLVNQQLGSVHMHIIADSRGNVHQRVRAGSHDLAISGAGEGAAWWKGAHIPGGEPIVIRVQRVVLVAQAVCRAAVNRKLGHFVTGARNSIVNQDVREANIN